MDLEKLKQTFQDFRDKTEEQVKTLIAEEKTVLDGTINEMKEGIEKATASIDQINEEIAKQKTLGMPGVNEGKETFSFAKMFNALLELKSGKSESVAWKDAGYEKEVIDQYATKRDASSTDGTAGGYLVPEEAKGDLIDLTIAKMPIMTMGITQFTGLRGDLPIPKITGRPTAYMVGEVQAPAKSDVTFGEIVLRPHKVAAFTKLSRRLAYQTQGNAETIIKDALSDAMALKMNDQLISGNGADRQVLGLRNQTSGMTASTALGTNGGRFRIDNAGEMIGNLDEADEYTDAGRYGYLMRPRVLDGMKRERIVQYNGGTEAAGAPVLASNLLINNKVLEDQLGHMIRTTTQISATETKGSSTTCSYTYFGNWKQFYVGLWRDMELRVSDIASDADGNSAFLNDQLFLVAFQEFDCNIGRQSAFTYVPDCENTVADW